MQLMFAVQKGDMPENNVAIDDISITEGRCQGNDYSCRFELGVCGFTDKLIYPGMQAI